MAESVPPPKSPALKPPPGIVPDFDGPFTLEPYSITTCALCIGLTTTLVLARMYTKVRIVKKVLWEDCKIYLPAVPHL